MKVGEEELKKTRVGLVATCGSVRSCEVVKLCLRSCRIKCEFVGEFSMNWNSKLWKKMFGKMKLEKKRKKTQLGELNVMVE